MQLYHSSIRVFRVQGVFFDIRELPRSMFQSNSMTHLVLDEATCRKKCSLDPYAGL